MFLFGKPNVERLQARRDVEGLIKALGHKKDWQVRQAAAEALGRLGDARAAESLIAALKDEHGYVRSAAVKALGNIGDARAIEPLVAALEDEDEYEYVCKASAEALGNIGDTRAIEPLVAALGLWDVSKPAAVALDRLGWQPGQDEIAIRYWIAKQEWGKCAVLGTAAVDTLIAMLKESAERGAFAQSMLSLERFSPPGAGWGFVAGMHGQECVEIREAACKVLVKIGAPAVLPLIDVLQDQSTWMRMTVAWVLGELGDDRAVAPLVTLLESKDALQGGDCLCDSPRQTVIEALAKIGTPAVEPFIAELGN